MAEKHRLPIVADEIYERLVFAGESFHSIASLSERVPVLSTSGIAKLFIIPGWRLGWLVTHDRGGAFGPEARRNRSVAAGHALQMRRCLASMSQVILGANSLVQSILPHILFSTPQSFFDDTNAQIERNAKFSFEALSRVPGLSPVMPRGTMYMMVCVCHCGCSAA